MSGSPIRLFAAYIQNLGRLILQLGRQVSGVLEGDESFIVLVGHAALVQRMGQRRAGLCRAARVESAALPAVGSQVLIMPWLSYSYGMIVHHPLHQPVDAADPGGDGFAGSGRMELVHAARMQQSTSSLAHMRWAAACC